MAGLPEERFKDSYKNWRYNPFTDADMAVDKEEDDLTIPSGSPFVIQLIESPRKNTPTTVLVRSYDSETTVDADSASGQKVLNVASTTGFASTDKVIVNRGGAREEECVIDTVQAGVSLTMVDDLAETHTEVQADDVEEYIEFTEVAGAPAQSQFRVDYPVYPVNGDGKGTALIEFNNGDANKVVRINYKGTGSAMTEELLNTKVSYPAGSPVDNQIIAFDTGAPTWKYNPRPYFHEGPVLYRSTGEDESCLLFRFKRRAEDQKVFLELKGAKLHQGYYTEMMTHNHGAGTLVNAAASNHTHGAGALVNAAASNHTHGNGTLAADAVAAHSHTKGTLAGSQPTHQHGDGTLVGAQATHTHGVGTLVNAAAAVHYHAKGTIGATVPSHDHGFTGTSAGGSNHSHVINNRSHQHPSQYDTGGNQTGLANGCSSPTANEGSHTHGKGTFAVGGRSLTITVSGNTANAGDHNHVISGSTAAAGNQAVTITGSVAAGGGDAVAIAGSTATGGGHGHNISGSTATDGGHNHVISGSTAADGGHNHVISGSTANASVTAKTYPDQLKIYINGVDKTTEVLALTGLTQFGNGNAGHAFVTTGSGEMDISSLVAATQIHELKITEPTAAKGGRCLLHLELY